MNLSFKPKQPTPMETVLSLARAIVVGGPWALVPEEKWHAMHERHEADSEALRSALARVVEVEARADRHEAARHALEETVIRLTAELANVQIRGGVIEALEKALAGERITYASERLTKATDAVAELATARGQP